MTPTQTKTVFSLSTFAVISAKESVVNSCCKHSYCSILFSKTLPTDQAKEKDQEKWLSIVKNFDSSLKSDNYNTALQLVDKYEAECKSPEFRLQALMKRVQGSFEAWKHTSKGRKIVLNREINYVYPTLLF